MTAPDDGLAVPTVDTPLPYTTAWTDGSSTGKVGPGGWAWCVLDGPNAGRQDAGGHPDTTNQRMELQAAHEAVRALPGLLLDEDLVAVGHELMDADRRDRHAVLVILDFLRDSDLHEADPSPRRVLNKDVDASVARVVRWRCAVPEPGWTPPEGR